MKPRTVALITGLIILALMVGWFGKSIYSGTSPEKANAADPPTTCNITDKVWLADNNGGDKDRWNVFPGTNWAFYQHPDDVNAETSFKWLGTGALLVSKDYYGRNPVQVTKINEDVGAKTALFTCEVTKGGLPTTQPPSVSKPLVTQPPAAQQVPPINIQINMPPLNNSQSQSQSVTVQAQQSGGTTQVTPPVTQVQPPISSQAQIQPPQVSQPSGPIMQTVPSACPPLPAAGNLDNMPKVRIEDAPQNTWFHRVFNPNLFKAPNWDGADSWFVTLLKGPSSGGSWTSFRNPGQIVFRATETRSQWNLGVLTTSKWKSQFMAGDNSASAALNVRILPKTPVTVTTNTGRVVSQTTSDGGDITIILPDDGTICVAADFVAEDPTFESQLWWGPHDRAGQSLNIIDGRQ